MGSQQIHKIYTLNRSSRKARRYTLVGMVAMVRTGSLAACGMSKKVLEQTSMVQT